MANQCNPVQLVTRKDGNHLARDGEIASAFTGLHEGILRNGYEARCLQHGMQQVGQDVLSPMIDPIDGTGHPAFVTVAVVGLTLQPQHLHHRPIHEVQVHLRVIGQHGIADGAEDVVELVALLHQPVLHQQTGLDLHTLAGLLSIGSDEKEYGHSQSHQQQRIGQVYPEGESLHQRDVDKVTVYIGLLDVYTKVAQLLVIKYKLMRQTDGREWSRSLFRKHPGGQSACRLGIDKRRHIVYAQGSLVQPVVVTDEERCLQTDTQERSPFGGNHGVSIGQIVETDGRDNGVQRSGFHVHLYQRIVRISGLQCIPSLSNPLHGTAAEVAVVREANQTLALGKETDGLLYQRAVIGFCQKADGV